MQIFKEVNMKKGTNILLSALLIFTLVFTSSSVVFAESGQSGRTQTVYNNKPISIELDKGQDYYFKFRAVKNGYLKLESYNYYGYTYGNATLCNSKKKAISSPTNLQYSPTFGVKKGKTYYIKVVPAENHDVAHTFTVINKAIREKSGKKKSKAVLLKKNKQKQGTIVAGEKRTDWYRFRVTKKSKKHEIAIKGATNNKIKVVIYRGNKRMRFAGERQPLVLNAIRSNSSNTTFITGDNWKKGTYYVKVYRGTSKSSGWYSLKWR